jgi:prolyl 4-hydroxylase
LAHDEDAQQIQLAPSKELPDGYECAHPSYKVHMFSKSPLVLYLEGFLTGEERLHLQDLA